MTQEPVRGSFGDPSPLQLPGIEAARMFVRGQLPLPPKRAAFAMGSSMVIPGAIEQLRQGRNAQQIIDSV